MLIDHTYMVLHIILKNIIVNAAENHDGLFTGPQQNTIIQ